ncbi:hypothetical protein [Clostridium botulinum]|uniref:hypothetical protein n=1 Tax=Clostridium botulinum TaxID=1491 RepID=UPI0004D3D547|nr:hypothetical protein [Clostridium botulinum]KEH96538.1 hypothetical protein Z953_p0117 [Clostridium botulinum D str. 16868]
MEKSQKEEKSNTMYKKLNNIFGMLIETIIQYIPLVFLIIITAMYILPFRNCLDPIFKWLIIDIFTKERVSSLVNISVILVGFYVTIMSIFGSNSCIAVVEMSKAKLANKFTSYIKKALLSTFIFLIYTIFYDTVKFRFLMFLYVIIFTWVIANLIRVAYLSIKLYEHNIKKAYTINEEQNKLNKEVLLLLREIKHFYQLNENKKNFETIKNEGRKSKIKSDKELPYDENL